MARLKAENDPWSPLPRETNGISHPPCDPRYQLIDSDRYIDTLERKLKGLKGRKGRSRPEPSSRDMIDSLAGFKDDQMRRFLQSGDDGAANTSASATPPSSSCDAASSSATATATAANYLQRRLFPERQALNMEELFELLKDDELARYRPHEEEEEEREETKAATATAAAGLMMIEACQTNGGETCDVRCSQHTEEGGRNEEGKTTVPGLLETGPTGGGGGGGGGGGETDPVCSQRGSDACSKEEEDDDDDDDAIASKQDEKDITNPSEEDSSCRQSDVSGKGEGDNLVDKVM